MKRIKLFLSLLFFVCTVTAFAQFDEKAILYQHAQRLTMQRQYVEAEQAWLQILTKYPSEINAVSQLFHLYLQINQPKKAEKLIYDYRNILPDHLRLEYDIQLDIQQAKLKSAWDKVTAYLQLSPPNENKYRLLASFYGRKGFFEEAINIYELGRKALNRNDLFNMEIGNNAFFGRKFDKALTEYVRFLEAQPGNLYFVGNQLKTIFTENPALISQLQNMAETSASFEVKEVYALSLSRLGKLKEALREYEKLPAEKLTAFANEQFAAGNDSLAIAAFRTLLTKQIDVNLTGDAILKLSASYIRLRQFAQAESVLTNIVNPHDKSVNPNFAGRRFAYHAFLLLSDLGWWQKQSNSLVLELLAEARKHAFNVAEQAEIDFRLVGNHFVHEKYDEAELLLQKINPSIQEDRQFYYKYLISMSNLKHEKADSLLNELVISNPSSQYVNDLMILNYILLNLPQNAQNQFLKAYRYRLSHNDSLAVDTMLELSQTAKDEELRVLAADWALASGFKSWAKTILEHEWNDELLMQYALLQISRLQTQNVLAENLAQDFLKNNPNSVFSPGFRQILQKSIAGRPSL